MRSFTRSVKGNHLVRYRSLQKKPGPRNALRPRLPNWQFFAPSPPAQAPVLGSTAEANASGFSHWMVPGGVTPAIGLCGHDATPGITLAYCGPLLRTNPFAAAAQGVVNTKKR